MNFVCVPAAAPEYSGVLTATVFLALTEEALNSALLLVDADGCVIPMYNVIH